VHGHPLCPRYSHRRRRESSFSLSGPVVSFLMEFPVLNVLRKRRGAPCSVARLFNPSFKWSSELYPKGFPPQPETGSSVNRRYGWVPCVSFFFPFSLRFKFHADLKCSPPHAALPRSFLPTSPLLRIPFQQIPRSPTFRFGSSVLCPFFATSSPNRGEAPPAPLGSKSAKCLLFLPVVIWLESIHCCRRGFATSSRPLPIVPARR